MTGPLVQTQRQLARPISFGVEDRTVERPSPGAAPSAFRIWEAGVNVTDDGPTVFSRQSAQLLMDEQAERGNLSSIDFDHLSLRTDRPAEAGRAAGWCTLGVRADERGEPELWAENVEWCADVKAGLEEQPPRWRYFSPACDVNVDTREVISYLNTALCINPKTHNNNMLATRASRKEEAMTKAQRDTLAVLNAMKASMSSDGEHKAAAESMYAMHGGAEEHEKLTKLAAESDPPESKPAESAAEGDEPAESTAAAEEPSPPTSRSPGSTEPAKATQVAASVSVAAARRPSAAAKPAKADEADPRLMATVQQMAARLAAVEADNEAMKEERRKHRVAQILASRRDLSTELRASLGGLRASQVRKIVDAIPKPARAVAPTATVTATRGADQGTDVSPAPPSVQAEVDKAMRIPAPAGHAQGFGKVIKGERQFHTRRPSEWREEQARAAAKGTVN